MWCVFIIDMCYRTLWICLLPSVCVMSGLPNDVTYILNVCLAWLSIISTQTNGVWRVFNVQRVCSRNNYVWPADENVIFTSRSDGSKSSHFKFESIRVLFRSFAHSLQTYKVPPISGDKYLRTNCDGTKRHPPHAHSVRQHAVGMRSITCKEHTQKWLRMYRK